jgi:hypothetical protein
MTLYHYQECGLDNVYLANGYREVETPYGPAVSVEDVMNCTRRLRAGS